MDFDELDPKTKKTNAPKDLSQHSITDLEVYIAELKNEITRSESEIKKREATRLGAEALFKR